MDRSLKLRTTILVGILLFCVATLAPSFVSKDSLPSWFTSVFSKKINLGLDLQGGLHLVYSIDLNKAIDDKASDIKRDLESKFIDDKVKATVKTPLDVLGGITVLAPDAASKDKIAHDLQTDYKDDVATRDCAPADGPNAVCVRVSSSYADSIKAAALHNAVSTIRDRIDVAGIADPTVIEKGDDIIVELAGLDDDLISSTRDIIARTAKLEFKVVDDGSQYMDRLMVHVNADASGNQAVKATDPDAIAVGIEGEIDQWRPEDGGNQHTDYYLTARDRIEPMTSADCKLYGSWNKNMPETDGKVQCPINGRRVIERYLYGKQFLATKKAGGPDALITKDPSFVVPDDHQIAFEELDQSNNPKDQRTIWRTYYLDRAVRLTGSGISNAVPSYDPNTNRPIVLVDFNRYGGRVFGDLTAQVVGKKVATILDDKIKSAPIINGAIRGGRASITMGGSDPRVQEKEASDLVAVLKTGSLPAPLREESASKVGPTLGRDAIDKTKVSFLIGISLVVCIMVGIYRWSGVIATVAVIFHIMATLAVMAVFGATLTLPGIAAIVLSIGMEVDGNILIYERIRDELLLGKSVRGAVDLGFSRAFSAILDGQLTTAAAGWVLLQYGSGPIKGFAVMLLVGVFTTLTTNIWVTRIFFDWYIARKKGQLATISI